MMSQVRALYGQPADYSASLIWGNCPIGRGAYNDAVLTNTMTANLSNALIKQYSIGSNPISPTIPQGNNVSPLFRCGEYCNNSPRIMRL